MKIWTDEKILADIRLRKDLNLPMNALAAFEDNGKLYQAARRRFGSWNQAVIVAGLEAIHKERKIKWPAEKIIAKIKKLHEQEKPLTAGFISTRYSYLYRVGITTFGSWTKTLIAAGIDPNSVRKKKLNQLNLPLKMK